MHFHRTRIGRCGKSPESPQELQQTRRLQARVGSVRATRNFCDHFLYFRNGWGHTGGREAHRRSDGHLAARSAGIQLDDPVSLNPALPAPAGNGPPDETETLVGFPSRAPAAVVLIVVAPSPRVDVPILRSVP